jgi:hypothetical protein
MIFSVRNLIYACLAATVSTTPVFANDDPYLKPPTNVTRTIPKPALKEDPQVSNGLNVVNQEQECVDVPGWQDSFGYGCDYYSQSFYNCYLFGWTFENDGNTANEACCACSGGNIGGGDDGTAGDNGGDGGDGGGVGGENGVGKKIQPRSLLYCIH